jgi:hypothetical protein
MLRTTDAAALLTCRHSSPCPAGTVRANAKTSCRASRAPGVGVGVGVGVRRLASPAEVDEMARACRVQRIVRPYLEAWS